MRDNQEQVWAGEASGTDKECSWTQWQQHHLEGKEPFGIYTEAAGEDISKQGQGAKF